MNSISKTGFRAIIWLPPHRCCFGLELAALAKMKAPYSPLGCPSVCPEPMVRMLIVGTCYSIRSERRLCQEVKVNLAYRWFCGLGLEDKVPIGLLQHPQ